MAGSTEGVEFSLRKIVKYLCRPHEFICELERKRLQPWGHWDSFLYSVRLITVESLSRYPSTPSSIWNEIISRRFVVCCFNACLACPLYCIEFLPESFVPATAMKTIELVSTFFSSFIFGFAHLGRALLASGLPAVHEDSGTTSHHFCGYMENWCR